MHSKSICAVCKKRVAIMVCRRCGRRICAKCHYHHGLCTECAGIIKRR